MTTRRTFLLALTCTAVALGLVVGPALADELIGRITKVDVDAKKIIVTEKDTDKEVEVTINDDTIVVTPKGERKVDLEKLRKGVEKAKKGFPVVVTHENRVASKIKYAFRKKGERKKDESK